MPALATILGKFKGGPSNTAIRVFEEGGRTRAEYLGSAGGRAGFEGVLLEGGKSLRGFWYDYDKKVTPGDRYQCTCVVTLVRFAKARSTLRAMHTPTPPPPPLPKKRNRRARTARCSR